LIRTERRTDRMTDGPTNVQGEMTKLYALFANYANAPKKERQVWRV